MYYFTDRITVDPEVCNGKPTIRGMRITVHTVLDFLAAGNTNEEIIKSYPMLENEDIEACLLYASKLVNNEIEIKPFAV